MSRTLPSTAPVPWVTVCVRAARQQGLPVSLETVLEAFSGAASRSFADFPALAADTDACVSTLPERIIAALDGAVDRGQAEMFARRFSAVEELLAGELAQEAAILRIGLVQRMEEVLSVSPASALRVRALVDFYYSQAALLRHRSPDLPPLISLAEGAEWQVVAPGVEHARLVGRTAEGPVFANALRVRGGRIAARDCRGQGSLPEIAAASGAIAAISGGFFLYSEPDIRPPSRRTDPVGLLVSDGTVRNPPIFRRSALLWDGDHLAIREVGMNGVVLCQGDVSVTIGAEGAAAFSRVHGLESPGAPFAVAVVGERITAAGPGPLPIPLAGAVITLPFPLPLVPGPVTWTLPAPVQEAMAGGPRLLRSGEIDIGLVSQDFAGSAPPVTFSQDETFDQNRLPRMAAGLCEDGALILLAIDGRNIEQALGTTLRQTAALCRALGCVEAMNLDGGSSKRMVVDGVLVDLSTTEVVAGAARSVSVRPVHSGILVFGP